MLSKTTIKYIRSLRDQKYRQKYHKIVVEGVKSVHDVLSAHLVSVETIFATKEWVADLSSVYPSYKTIVEQVDDHELKLLSSFTTPQQVLAICAMPVHIADPDKALTELCLYLDGVRDPGNMGTIFRIADWFGISNVFLSGDCVDPYNPKVIQASMGSIFRVNRREMHLHELLGYSEIQVFAATMHGANLYQTDLPPQGLIVLGNEASGIRELPTQPNVHQISIPTTLRLGAESLNVAVAAGIICAEFRRRDFQS